MALPQNYKTWEHLQDLLIRDHNKLLAKYFKDLGPNWEPEIATTRGNLRTAVTIFDNDTATITLLKLFYFYVILGYAFDNLAPVYGIPTRDFQENYELHPQIFLYFSQDKSAVPNGESPVTAEISFRLKSETKESMTPAKAAIIANRIKNEFVQNNKGVTFTKGKEIITYTDPENGLKCLQIFALNESEGEKIIKNILQILRLTFDAKKLGKSDKYKKPSITKPQGTEKVYGKTRKKKRWRPTAQVRFRYAYLYIDNVVKPIFLVDTTKKHFDAIVKVE